MSRKRENFLMIICWVAYMVAQLGRYSYSSNINLIMDKFAIEHAEASLPATFFFFAYGIGQILVGLFCHKVNRKILVVSALLISAIMNFLIFFGAEFMTIKHLWLLNGFAQANLWPVLMLIIRENVSSERISTASVIMATASTGGKFASIGICAIFAINTSAFMYCFFTAGLLLFVVALLFLFTTGKIKGAEIKQKVEVQEEKIKQKVDVKSVVLLLLLGEFSLVCFAVTGGLQQWVPSIIKESYGFSDALSIFMSLLLPLFTLSVAFISPYLYKKLKNYVFISLLFFAIGAILIVGVLLFLDISWIVVMVLFTMEAIAMGIISNTTTVQVPLTFKGKFDAGFLAGFLNGACYIGTAIATYALGYLADISGWTLAFIVLISVSVFSAILAGIYLVFSKRTRTAT